MGSYKILIVDDFADFRRFISSIVQQKPGLQIIGEAVDGLEALEKAKELQPDLILLDLGMPKLNGLETAKRLPLFAPNTKILFVSQETSPDIVLEALRPGGRGYVNKLRAMGDLLPAIDAVLRGKQFISPELEIRGGTETEALHRHEILLCHDDAAMLDSFAHFIAAALSEGSSAIVLATEAHRDSLVHQLRALGVRIDAAIQQGRYIALDADEPIDAVEFLDTIRAMSEAATKAGKMYPRVAFCGERAGRLWVGGKKDEATQLEQLCDDLAKSENVDVLCVYPFFQTQDDIPTLDSLFARHSAASYR